MQWELDPRTRFPCSGFRSKDQVPTRAGICWNSGYLFLSLAADVPQDEARPVRGAVLQPDALDVEHEHHVFVVHGHQVIFVFELLEVYLVDFALFSRERYRATVQTAACVLDRSKGPDCLVDRHRAAKTHENQIMPATEDQLVHFLGGKLAVPKSAALR